MTVTLEFQRLEESSVVSYLDDLSCTDQEIVAVLELKRERHTVRSDVIKNHAFSMNDNRERNKSSPIHPLIQHLRRAFLSILSST